jgi:hypothetical protein
MTSGDQNTANRHSSVQHLVDLLDPNPALPEGLAAISRRCAELRDEMLDECKDGPELSAGLRKLLEAKDCFVRQALLDSRGQ